MATDVTLAGIFEAMSRASCGEMGVRLANVAELDPEVAVNRVGIALNVLLADLEYRRAEAERALTAVAEAQGRCLAEAEEALHLRDEFLSIASHELYTPLTSLQLLLQGVRREAGAMTPEQMESKLALAERQTRKLSILILQLLDVSRLRAGPGVPLRLEDVDLAAVVREKTEESAEDARRAGCVLSLRAESPVVGRWDRSRIEQIVGNLLANALKFGRGKPVELAVSAEGEAARLTVRDHGIGIVPDALPRIFECCQRAVPAKQYGGLGLGLYVVREIVCAHGGSVRVESDVGRGSTFTVELPRADHRSEARP
jgi:signal transduction histidine kinase